MMVKFEELFRLSAIKRWHMVPCTREQTVAEHTFNVMCLSLHFSVGLSSKISAACMVHGFSHDMSECAFGDITPMAKKEYGLTGDPVSVQGWPEYYTKIDSMMLNKEEVEQIIAIVKIADVAEALRFVLEYGTGNYSKEVISDLSRELVYLIDSMPLSLPPTTRGNIRDKCAEFINVTGNLVL